MLCAFYTIILLIRFVTCKLIAGMFGAGAVLEKIFPCIDAGLVAIHPLKLTCIRADKLDSGKFISSLDSTIRRRRDIFMHEHGFTGTARAWTNISQQFKRINTLMSVLPYDCYFGWFRFFNADRFHTYSEVRQVNEPMHRSCSVRSSHRLSSLVNSI